MDKNLRAILQNVVVAGREFLKASNAVMDKEYGAGVQKAANAATAGLVDAGFADANLRSGIQGELVFNKAAAYDVICKLAARSAALPLGAPDNTKQAATESNADDLWNRRWGF